MAPIHVDDQSQGYAVWIDEDHALPFAPPESIEVNTGQNGHNGHNFCIEVRAAAAHAAAAAAVSAALRAFSFRKYLIPVPVIAMAEDARDDRCSPMKLHDRAATVLTELGSACTTIEALETSLKVRTWIPADVAAFALTLAWAWGWKPR